jgi:DNA-binding transcriptional LysR family regulator
MVLHVVGQVGVVDVGNAGCTLHDLIGCEHTVAVEVVSHCDGIGLVIDLASFRGSNIATGEGAQISGDFTVPDLLATELRAGDVDFVLGALRPSAYANDLHSEALLQEEMVILVRRNHPWLKRIPVYADLSAARWVLPRAGSPARQLLDAFFIRIGITAPNPVIETGDLAILRGVLLRSVMLAAVSAHQLEHEMASDELVRLPLPLSHTTRPIGLISRAGSLQSPAAQALMDKIREVAGRRR